MIRTSLRKPNINPTLIIAMKKEDTIFNTTKHRLNSTQDIQITKLERTISFKADEDYSNSVTQLGWPKNKAGFNCLPTTLSSQLKH